MVLRYVGPINGFVFSLKKMSCIGLMFLASTMPAYAVGFFITPILRSMGYSVSESLLLSAPPAGAAVRLKFPTYLTEPSCLMRKPFR